MRSFSRTVAGWDLRLVAAATLAVGWAAVLAAFAYGAASASPSPKTLGAAALLLGIAATGFLYAWREPGV
jgi:hypothetical protein